jgi:phosphohistidine phosphatase
MDMRRLTLLRHGQAQSGDSCPEDFERVLTRRGTHQAEEMGRRLVERNLVPELILTSPAERAFTTAGLIAAACELEAGKIECARELYLATPETIWRVLTARDLPFSHILLCGHNPGLSELASRLGPHPQTRELSTAGLASAVWHAGQWTGLEPETAYRCDFDDPDNLTDSWL